ncbi:MAG: hypothetical protein MUF16_09540 [Burkholderiaceae bacterium]|jgi:hypothetical protein|nr:hypothetical protein [Burkholderiaceae bacterium]
MKPARGKGGQARPPSLLPNPHFEWLQSTSYAYYGSDQWLPVLMQFQDRPKGRGLTAQAFARQVLAMQALDARRQGWAADVRIPECWAAPGAACGRHTHFIALLARRKFLDDVYRGVTLSGQVRRFEVGRAIATPLSAKPQALPAAPFGPGPGVVPAVITGVIDDGIGFAHDRLFSADDTTRIEYFWDQQLPSAAWGPWGYGSEFSKRDPAGGIDRRLSNSRYGPWVDEDEVYRLSGQADHAKRGLKPLAARQSHGAHVADLACNRPGPGTPPARPLAGVRPIIAVQLPATAVAETSGATLMPQIYSGLCYILHKAQQLASRCGRASLPVAVNVSYGLISGPHDGSGALEAAIDELLIEHNPPGSRPVRVVLPAGNNFLSRCHASFTLDAHAIHELAWRVLPDDRTESSLDIWLPRGAKVDALSVQVSAPDGGTGTGPFNVGGQTWFDVGNSRVGQAWFHASASPTQRARITLWLAPTADPEGRLPLAQAGLWRIQLDNRAGGTPIRRIEAWIQRDDTAPGYRRRGRQSYFDDRAYQRYDDGGREIEVDQAASYVKREGSFNAIATGRLPVVAGGYRRSDARPSPYSAAGPVRPPRRGQPNPDGPECMLPSDDSPSQWGRLGAGTRSNSCVALQGTSVAAPQLAAALAEWAALNLPNDRSTVHAAAQAQEALLPPLPQPKPKRVRGGGGRVRTDSNRPPRREA